jgi:phage portal protein BeeE
VFACIEARRLVFSEARPMWQALRRGIPDDVFSSPELDILRRPWPNGTSGELLSRMEQDVSLAGNFYAVRERDRLRRLRPDWVSIILTAPPEEATGSDVAGYEYKPGGPMSKATPVFYFPEKVCHWSPIPDPEAQYRGMSWVTPAITEIQSDAAATRHKLKFFENGATISAIASLKETVTKEQFIEFMKAFKDAHQGVDNAYKTLFVGGGADVKLVGADLRQLDFKVTQGAGETRIAAMARVHPAYVGLSEGMQGSSLNAGNMAVVRRSFADGFLRPQWKSAFGALERIVPPPNGAQLWYYDRGIAFLREDEKDAAEIELTKSSTVAQYVREGFTPESAVAAVEAQDITLLVHTGLVSVQLQKPGANNNSADAPVGEQPDPADAEEDE